jgi:two-component system NtrC family response regulator
VLILGESGTGKEMAALAIHRRSARKDGPFVAINCGAIPENLLESELFGHEKGAFTGAHIQRNGQIEVANGGTLLLDEIGELPGALQVKLLRFLQDQRVIRVGGRTEIPVNVRVISATNTDIKRAMERGRFREDLYYRLAVVTMSMPPLRERAGDIAALAEAFLARFTAQSGRKVVGFTPQAARALEAHDWPGNIRELENRIRRAVIMAEGRRVTAADLELGASADGYAGLTLPQARERLEKDLIRRALARHRGKISPAAAELGISRPTLYEMMSALKIQKPKPKRRG